MDLLKRLLGIVAVLALVGCGGGGSTNPKGPDGGDGDGSSNAKTVEVIATGTSVGTGTGDTVTIQAFVKDGNNNALADAPVQFSTTTGTLNDVSATTDESGVATATFSAGAVKSNRTARISVVSGGVSSTLDLPITGTKLNISGPTSLLLGESGVYTVIALDSKGNALSNIAVTTSSSLGNGLRAIGNSVTDANGQVQFSYEAGRSGTDKVVFSMTGYSAPALDVAINGDEFEFTSPAAASTVNVGSPVTLEVRLLDDGEPLANKQIRFATTGGKLSPESSLTDPNGVATTELSSSSAGQVTVQATVVGTGATTTLPLVIVAKQADRLVLQVSPAAIAPNASGSTASRSRLIAKVTDPSGNPVQGVTVNFTRTADPSNGNLDQPSALTDLNGQAAVWYIAGAESTADNGVMFQAYVPDSANAIGAASLTVNRSALFITLGTGNLIENLDEQTYKKNWTVYVTDSNGVAVSGVPLTLKVLPLYYYSGVLEKTDDGYDYSPPIYECPNEDADFDGVLGANEDANDDGVLWPGNVISVAPGTVTTDENGRATVSILYAESFSPWVKVRLTATARVAGTESHRDAEFIVPASAEDMSGNNGTPAGRDSPFLPTEERPLASNCRLWPR